MVICHESLLESLSRHFKMTGVQYLSTGLRAPGRKEVMEEWKVPVGEFGPNITC